MRFSFLPLLLAALFTASMVAAQHAQPSPSRSPEAHSGADSSSLDNLDLSPLPNAKTNSSTDDTSSSSDEVDEAHSFNPYRASKDVEVGDFYFKRKNYPGALARYRDALVYKENDAAAAIGAARCEEKLGQLAEARAYYESYLKILPNGPRAEEAKKALAKLPLKH